MGAIQQTPRAIGERVLELLAGIDAGASWSDEDEVARHVRAYVQALGLPAPRVRFAPDIRTLRKARVYPAEDRHYWQSFTGRQHGLLERHLERRWGWSGRGWRQAAEPAGTHPAVEQLVAWDRTVREAGLGVSRDVRGVRGTTPSLYPIARLLAGEPTQAPARVQALVPLAEAAAAGLFALAVGRGGKGDLVALLRPRMRFDEEGRLHDWDGLPAAEWRNGTGLYFWRGVEMTESAGRRPDEVTPSRVLRWRNAERRRVAIERIGLERFLQAVGADVIQEDDYGRLWRTNREVDGEPFLAVEVVNSTAEPDGSYRRYFLRVPPSVRTARRAVAWTFGLTTRAYAPAVQS